MLGGLLLLLFVFAGRVSNYALSSFMYLSNISICRITITVFPVTIVVNVHCYKVL